MMLKSDNRTLNGEYDGPDKRYLPRWEVNSRVLCRQKDEETFLECRSMDLSCSGTCLVMRQPLSVKEKVKLTVYLTETKAVDVEGLVAWSRASGYGHLAGVSFQNTTLEMQDTILKYAFEVKKNDLVHHWFDGCTPERNPKAQTGSS